MRRVLRAEIHLCLAMSTLAVQGQASGDVVVSEPGVFAHSGAWSPDGTQLAYLSDADGDFKLDLFVVNCDGTGRIPILLDDDVSYANYALAWAIDPDDPGNSWIYFVRNPEREVFRIRADGSQLTQVTCSSDDSRFPLSEIGISDDGTRIVFRADEGSSGWYDVFAADLTIDCQVVDTKCEVNPGSGHTNDFALYPDGSFVLYATGSNHNQPHTIYGDVTACSNNDVELLSSSLSSYLEYVVSPDQMKLVYTDGSVGSRNIIVCDEDGSNCTTVASTADNAFNRHLLEGFGVRNPQTHHIWAPDSARIYFCSNEAGTWDLYSIAAQGSDRQQITSDASADETWPLLSPDGTKLAYIRTSGNDRELVVQSLPQITPCPGCDVNQTAKLTASDADADDRFGVSVAIDGNLAVVGAFFDDGAGNNAGATYVYRMIGTSWVEQAKLTASDAADNDEFGVAVSISGDVVVVGAHRDDDGGLGSGSAYVFEMPSGGWANMTETAKLTASDATSDDEFGVRASISGDVVAIGAPLADPGFAGAVYVFKKPPGGWIDATETAKLTASGTPNGHQLGQSVSISDDVVAAGAWLDDHAGFNTGSAYVFVMPPGGWVDMTETAKLTSSDAAANDQFGTRISVSGEIVIVGVEGDDDGGDRSGSAHVFQRPVGGWATMTETQKLTACDADPLDQFGLSVAVDGDTAVIGAWNDGNTGAFNGHGAAYIFRFDGTDWLDEGKLIASDAAAGDRFGYSVSISGDVVLIGADQENVTGTALGSAYIYGGLSDCNSNGALDICDIAGGGSLDTNSNGIPDECENDPPVCNAGGPYSAPCTGPAATIPLDGTGSSDPDNDPLTYEWTTDCPNGSFDDLTSSMPTLTADSFTTTCDVTLTVTDDGGASDTCSTTVTLTGADILVMAAKHTVGSGSHPGSTKEPLVGIEVCAYDKSEGSCSRTVCGGISHQHYECIALGEDLDSNGDPQIGPCTPVNCCMTDADGQCTINLPPDDYVIITRTDDVTKTVLPDPLGVSASGLLCGELKQKHLQQIVKSDGKKVPGKTTRLTGSELLIIEPEVVVWDETEQAYPFVFETVGDWNVTTSVMPPEGFVADYDSLSAVVDNELQAVQFIITEVGSDLVPTETRFEVTHKGRREVIHSRVGIYLTPEYARSRGFNVARLRAKGLIKERPGNQGHGRGQGQGKP